MKANQVPMPSAQGADVLADHLRYLILSGGIRPGELLPTERELVVQTGMGRSTIRQALQTLAGSGLVETRAGRNGGWVVLATRPDSVARSIDAYVRTNGVSPDEVLQVRRYLEPACAELAALHRTDDDLRDLDAIHAQLRESVADDTSVRFLDLIVEWHLAVAKASHNGLLYAFMQAVSTPVRQELPERQSTMKRRQEILQAHEAVTLAVRRGDAGRAVSAMTRHVGAYIEIMNSAEAGTANR